MKFTSLKGSKTRHDKILGNVKDHSTTLMQTSDNPEISHRPPLMNFEQHVVKLLMLCGLL